MDTSVLESEKQLGARMGISLKVLQKWRLNGDGPPWYRIGPQLVRYNRAEVDAWLTSRAGLPDRRQDPDGYAQLIAERQAAWPVTSEEAADAGAAPPRAALSRNLSEGGDHVAVLVRRPSRTKGECGRAIRSNDILARQPESRQVLGGTK